MSDLVDRRDVVRAELTASLLRDALRNLVVALDTDGQATSTPDLPQALAAARQVLEQHA